eukprot:CAMPEP_0201621720 /NCGR_PEP_ID=MMETSP0492-20130828/47019_1 /ASSEMBLY_ACC=CAM_ASM_000837 /TAXON_ID=420259 /ORGANISM="Thalassiosira gravida, Strain GMp14c1" /LENGTH=276 /DNA_ID=CAMNT_0048091279 /DNA_START=1174 /DNA_END=2004 /DNA_ORIENTATION=-
MKVYHILPFLLAVAESAGVLRGGPSSKSIIHESSFDDGLLVSEGAKKRRKNRNRKVSSTSTSKGSTSKDSTSTDSTSKDSTSKDSTSKNRNRKVSSTSTSKGSTSKDSTSKDSTSKDSTSSSSLDSSSLPKPSRGTGSSRPGSSGANAREQCPGDHMIPGPGFKQCICEDGYHQVSIRGERLCHEDVPLGGGCENQTKPTCREMVPDRTAKCWLVSMCFLFYRCGMCLLIHLIHFFLTNSPSPPRGDMYQCVIESGANAGVCRGSFEEEFEVFDVE